MRKGHHSEGAKCAAKLILHLNRYLRKFCSLLSILRKCKMENHFSLTRLLRFIAIKSLIFLYFSSLLRRFSSYPSLRVVCTTQSELGIFLQHLLIKVLFGQRMCARICVYFASQDFPVCFPQARVFILCSPTPFFFPFHFIWRINCRNQLCACGT